MRSLSTHYNTTAFLLRHYWVLINYSKLIEFQAMQVPFAPVASRGATIKGVNRSNIKAEHTKVNRMNKAKVKTYGRSGK